MNKKEFCAAFAEENGFAKYKVEETCEMVLEFLKNNFEEMKPGERVSFQGFGTFTKKHKKAHPYRDISTGEMKMSPARDVIVFAPSQNSKSGSSLDKD